MFDMIMSLRDPTTLVSVFAAIAVGATILTLAMPLLSGDRMSQRMRYVARERDKLRSRERARLNQNGGNVSLRQSPRQYVLKTVERFNLRKMFESQDTRDRLRMAGYRSEAQLMTFLFLRLALPIAFFLAAVFYLFITGIYADQPAGIRLLIAMGAAYAGFFAPNIYIANKIQKRQQDIRLAFPDALDLLLICVESGMSIEAAFRKVSEEVGAQSVPLAEELTLTTAELSYLQDRRQAYENLGKRTGLPGVKAVVTALVQAERYGTPLGTALRVMAQENRDMRMNEAEKKAAALPPKLTVPMIVFFLPVLFVIILGPAGLRLMDL